MALDGSGWISPPAIPPLLPDEVHVWRVALQTWPREGDSLLSPDERARSERLIRDQDRRGFVVARCTLRRLLGAYLQADARTLCFHYGPYGKPELSPPAGLQFSLAHSGDVALIALAQGHPLGIDVERLDDRRDGLAIASRFFSPAEAAALASQPEEGRGPAFFTAWVRKEAFLKATGRGLSDGLSGFEVSIPPEPARLVAVAGDPTEAERWSVLDVEPPGAGYTAALAVEGRGWTLKCWDWPA
jgi:4'-phosphopantetheinyl transferase